jgi:hypothetical protein
VRHQLTKSHIRREPPYFGQYCQRLSLYVGHGSRSLILGSPANALGSLPITSTRTRVPGANLAIRVARNGRSIRFGATPQCSLRTSLLAWRGSLTDLSDPGRNSLASIGLQKRLRRVNLAGIQTAGGVSGRRPRW